MATGTSFTTFLANKLLDHVFRNTAYTPAVTVYLALFTGAPGEAGGGTEVTGGSYARQAITCSAAAASVITNSVDINFGAATADWGVVTHVAVMDALTVGNNLAYGALVQSKDVRNGDTFKISPSKLTIALD